MANSITSSVNADYAKLLPRYKTIRDCLNDDVVSGGYYLDGVRNEYLIKTPGMADDTFAILKQLGRYTNYTGSTLDAMMGLASRTAPVFVPPTGLEYFEQNADGEGNRLQSMVKDALADTMSLGRFGVLVEPPGQRFNDAGEAISSTKADVQSGKVRTTLKAYTAESIPDYEVSIVNDVKQLSLVKLMEQVTKRNPETFRTETETQYRFLILTSEGYEQRVFEDLDGAGQIGATIPITGYDGKQLDHIPFYFSGSRNNDPTADNPPYYKLADKNIAIYNSDANNRLNLQLYATGSLFVTGDAQDLGKKNLAIGGGNGVYLGETGSVSLLQLQAGTALPEAIQQDKNDMVELGAKLAAPSVQRTLGEAEISATQEMALLTDVTDNVEMMFKAAINEASMLQTGKEVDVELTLNRKFFTRAMTAQDRAQWMSEIVSGISPATLYYKRLRESGDYPQDWTDEQIKEAMEPMDTII